MLAERTEGLSTALARGFAAFLGSFTLLNLVGGAFVEGFDPNLWWIDLRRLPGLLADAFLGISALALLLVGSGARLVRPVRVAVGAILSLLILAAVHDAAVFYGLLLAGRIRAGTPFPVSMAVAAGLGGALVVHARAGAAGARGRTVWVACAFAVFAVLFPVLQMVCFGKTDYRRPADVAVVFGARVYADGRPSDSLSDRVRTACRLHRDGLVRKLVLSGGPGDGPVHETECMLRLAVSFGVPEADVLLDPGGLSTDRTVANTVAMFRREGLRRVLAVSHFYHLPRIKLRYQREGQEVWTVPAEESYTLRKLPYFMAREVAALWAYWLRAVLPLPRDA